MSETGTSKAQKMEGRDVQQAAKATVYSYVVEHLDKIDPIPEFTVFVVWFTKTLQNWKAMVSTTLPDGMYYEVTYNGNAGETYLDVYKKFNNIVIKD
jgi:hypothetical protein